MSYPQAPGYGPPPGQYPPPGGTCVRCGQPLAAGQVASTPAGPMHFPCSAEAYKQPPKKGFPVWAIVLVAMVGMLSVCGVLAAVGRAKNTANDRRPSSESKPSESRPSQPASPDVTATIGEILKAYKGNELGADSTYKGKRVRVTGGVLDSIKKDILDQPYVTIGTGAPFEIPQVQCSLAGDQVAKAARMNKGDRVTVTGDVEGLLMNVQMKDCEFW